MKFIKTYRLKDYKFILVICVILLSIIGILVVGSAQPSVQSKQILGVILGCIAMIVLSLIDYNWLLHLRWLIYLLNIVLLLSVSLFGTTVNNAKRWIDLGFTRFQPSDLTKILMILFFAKLLMDHEEELKANSLKLIGMCILLIMPSLIFIYKQPNLSTTICIALLFCILMYLGGLSYKLIGTTFAIIIPVAAIFIGIVIQPNQPFLKDYQQKRILAWIEPDKYADDTAYQQINSVMAIGSGQLSGKGLDNNTKNSVKNGNFISEAQTDFIFAIIGEELGFVGCCMVIILLLLIIIQCILIGLKAQNLAGQIICGGVAALIGIQSFINIGVATRILPNTGLSLPFVSYGLTSVVCFFMGIGFVLNVGLQPKKYQ